MATAEDATLILKLYELRTEETMRKARAFVISEFHPQSFNDILALFTDRERPELNAYFRQVTSYWDMAAAMVNHGAINAELFYDSNPEAVAVWAKVSDFINELRSPAAFGPTFLGNLERLVQNQPDGAERVQRMKETFKRLAAMRAAQGK